MEMVEKVARAIDPAAWEDDPDANYPLAHRRVADRRAESLTKARAAIGAMREADDAMTEAALDEAGWRAEPYVAPREGGVPVGQDLTEDEAAYINNQGKTAMADSFRAMIDAALTSTQRCARDAPCQVDAQP